MRPTILNPLFAPLSSLDGIGPKLEKTLGKLLKGPDDEAHVGDLLFHLPHTIIDRRNQPGIAAAPEGAIVTLKVLVDRHQAPPRGNQRVPYRVFVHDESGEMALVFFRGHASWLEKLLPEGETRFVSGRVEWFNGRPNMVHPDHVVPEAEFDTMPLVEPVYPLTAGLSSKVFEQSGARRTCRLAAIARMAKPASAEKAWLAIPQRKPQSHSRPS